MNHLALFALGASHALGREIAGALGIELSPVEERAFEDGEFKLRPLASIRGHDVHVVSSLHGERQESGADKLLKLLFFIGALKDSGASRVTAVTPYLCFSRKDRRTKPRDPIATRYVAQLFEAMRTDAVITIDAHNVAAFENAFRCATIPLDAHALFARHFVPIVGDAPVAVVSPDLGGEKRAELFRQKMERLLKRPVAKAFMDKTRSEGRVTGDLFAGDVEGRAAIILDDLIAGGGTIARTAATCREHGAAKVFAAATHAVFAATAPRILGAAPIDGLVVTDSIPLARDDATVEALKGRLTIIPLAALLAQAIRRQSAGGSIARLLEDGP